MKILAFILISFSAQAQNAFAKITIRPSIKLSDNVDSLFNAILPLHPDSSKVPLKPKFYDALVLTRTGKICAYKIHGKPWTNLNTQSTLNSFILSILYYLKKDVQYYQPNELYENRWPDKLQVFRRSDSMLLATFSYAPINYKLPKQ